MYGVAAILEDAGHAARLHWTVSTDPRPCLHTDLSTEDIAANVRDHAYQHTAPDSWIQQNITLNGRVMALMSPRISKLGTDDWPRLQQERHRVLDTLHQQDARLDQQLIAALGEPCYWHCDEKGAPLQDTAASRWEMQPRNRGSEIVTNRFRPLAEVVSTWSTSQILNGLTGATTTDTIGKARGDSRTATGLGPLGPTDNALTWCALWGMSQLPVVHQIQHFSDSVGHNGAFGAGVLYLPAWTRPWPLARLRTQLTRPELHVFADERNPEGQRNEAGRTLADHGLVALVRFPIERYGTDKAPERRSQIGTIMPLPDTSESRSGK